MLYYDGRAPHGRALRNIDGGLGKSFRTVDDELRRVDSFRIIYFRAESFPRPLIRRKNFRLGTHSKV